MTARRALVAVLLLAAAPALTALDSGPWKQASRDYVVRLPADHVSHPAYRIEWWYYTGNLQTDRGRRFGYQITFFRIGVDPSPANPSKWSVRDLLMAHIAVTDAAGGRHLFAERVSRAGVGWAGASQRDLRVWNEDWEVRLEYGRHRLQARDPRFAIDLLLERGPAAGAPRRARLQPEGIERGQRHALLLAHANADRGLRDARRRAVRREGRQLDGPRIRHQLPRKAPAGLGLVFDSAGRRRGLDDVPDAAGRRQPRPAKQRHARAAGPAQSTAGSQTTSR